MCIGNICGIRGSPITTIRTPRGRFFKNKRFLSSVGKSYNESIKIKILAPFEILLGDATAVNIKYNNKVIKVPYFNPDNNVGKIKINN